MNEDQRQQLRDLMKPSGTDQGFKGVMRLALNKCPKCGKKMVQGDWIKSCPSRICNGYVGPTGKAGKLPEVEEEKE